MVYDGYCMIENLCNKKCPRKFVSQTQRLEKCTENYKHSQIQGFPNLRRKEKEEIPLVYFYQLT